jgi:benzodiazapine receptor
MTASKLAALLLFLVVTFSAAAIGGYATTTSVSTWFLTLQKPSWNPPPWVFGPVWTVLYASMAVAAWLVWQRRGAGVAVGAALAAYFVQLALNAAWSVAFFGLRRPGLALADIVLLWLAIAVCAVLFFRVSRVAGALMLPYLAWVSFASALNYSIWSLNR